jgi:N-sulfoglucosamine sulfohydrolase
MTCSTSYSIHFLRVALAAFCLLVFCVPGNAASRPNLLLITVDDMSADSVGVYGSAVEAITPNIDHLAAQGIHFRQAHVQVANCTPSRNVMWSGRYPHSSGVEGFYPVRNPGYPVLPDLLKDEGYFTAIRGKVIGSTPYWPYDWDQVLDDDHDMKDPASYGRATSRGIQAARAAHKPFALMINISDPHVPLYGLDKEGNLVDDPFPPSRIYKAGEVTVPGYLVDDEVVRREMSHYYSSVRRADDAVGEVLRALSGSGEADNTLVMFISDHGMPFPFGKTQLYHQSTWTPLVFRWPGVIAPGATDAEHMVSAVDILPTLLDTVGVAHPEGLQGRSFLPLLRGKKQDGRDRVFKEHNENSKGVRSPMRGLQDPRYLYLFNPWSNGKRKIASATRHNRTYQRMKELSEQDNQLAARLHLLNYRVPEELYDVSKDPDCLVNLVGDPAHAGELARLRGELEEWMRLTADPALEAFLKRDDPQFLDGYMAKLERASRERVERDRQRRRERMAREIERLLLEKQAEESAREQI